MLVGFYAWADERAAAFLVAGALFPLIGAVLARIGKGGKTDEDGKWIASAVVGVGATAVAVEASALALAHGAFGSTPLDANAMLLLAPMVCLAGALAGIRLVFPLNELASVRSIKDIGAFVAACAGVAYLGSKFRGWGIVFFGGLGQLIALLMLGYVLLRRLFKSAFGGGEEPKARLPRAGAFPP